MEDKVNQDIPGTSISLTKISPTSLGTSISLKSKLPLDWLDEYLEFWFMLNVWAWKIRERSVIWEQVKVRY